MARVLVLDNCGEIHIPTSINVATATCCSCSSYGVKSIMIISNTLVVDGLWDVDMFVEVLLQEILFIIRCLGSFSGQGEAGQCLQVVIQHSRHDFS